MLNFKFSDDLFSSPPSTTQKKLKKDLWQFSAPWYSPNFKIWQIGFFSESALQHSPSTFSTLTILYYLLIFFLPVFRDSARVLRFSPGAQPQIFLSPPPPKNYPQVGLRFSTVSTYPIYSCLFLILVFFSFSSSQCWSANFFTPTFLWTIKKWLSSKNLFKIISY